MWNHGIPSRLRHLQTTKEGSGPAASLVRYQRGGSNCPHALEQTLGDVDDIAGLQNEVLGAAF